MSNLVVTAQSDDGYNVGQSASSKVGYYGATPVVQPSGAAQDILVDTSGGTAVAATGITTITGTYNSVILADAVATIVVLVNKMRLDLVNLGLLKGGA